MIPYADHSGNHCCGKSDDQTVLDVHCKTQCEKNGLEILERPVHRQDFRGIGQHFTAGLECRYNKPDQRKDCHDAEDCQIDV